MAQNKGEGSAAPLAITNPNLPLLRKELFQLSLSLPPSTSPSTSPSDRPWGALILYLFGVVLRNVGDAEEARKAFLSSISLFPCNWSAWKDLSDLSSQSEASLRHTMPSHWMKDFFIPYSLAGANRHYQAIVKYEEAASKYGDTIFLQTRIASAYYHLGQFGEAEKRFQQIRKADPTSLDGMDLYSHILYINEDLPLLSQLSHESIGEIGDRYRVESSCIIGNYYAAKGDHRKAIVNFRRALSLNRSYYAAWTLIGHEYIELKMYSRAIQCYRTATALDGKDYKPWYMLGQVYEILKLPDFSLFYYRKAASLQPYDARMWEALGTAYENVRPPRIEDALKAYYRALENNNRDVIALGRLGKLHKERGETEKCVEHWRWLAVVTSEDGPPSADFPDEYLEFLSEWCMLKMRVEERGEGERGREGERERREKEREALRAEALRYIKMMIGNQATEKRGEALMARLREDQSASFCEDSMREEVSMEKDHSLDISSISYVSESAMSIMSMADASSAMSFADSQNE